MLNLGGCIREKAQKLLLVANRTSDPEAAAQLRDMSGELLALAARVDAKEFGSAVLDIDETVR